MSKFIVVDIETDALDWKSGNIHGIASCTEEDNADYTLFKEAKPSIITLPTIAHNSRFDLKFLTHRGWKFEGPIYDSMVLAQLVDENSSVGLKNLAVKHLGNWAIEGKGELDSAVARAQCRNLADLIKLDLERGQWTDIIAQYAKEDVNNTYKLFLVLYKKLVAIDKAWKEQRGALKGPLDYLKEEAQPIEAVLLKMEMRGIAINPDAIQDCRRNLEEELAACLESLTFGCSNKIKLIEEKLYEFELSKRKSERGQSRVEKSSLKYKTKFSWNSPQQVGSLIYDHFGLPSTMVSRTAKGSYSTSESDLSTLRSNIRDSEPLAIVLDGFSKLRSLEKLRNTYVAPDSSLLEGVKNGRVYSLYLQAGSSKEGGKGGTATGRLSSQSPNMQNLPRTGGVKRFFVPDSGYVFLYFDYSQVELRIAAHLSKDPELVRAYTEGLDLHKQTAAAMFGINIVDVTKEQRQAAKTLNFAMIYDASAYRIFGELGPLGYSLEDCTAFRTAFFKQFPGYHKYLKGQYEILERDRMVISETGRVRRLPDMAYGQYLDWRTRTLRKEIRNVLVQQLYGTPYDRLSNEELFERARKKYKHAQKQGLNFCIQSLGASITKRALINLHNLGYDIVTSVHDSIILQVKPEVARDQLRFVQKILENNYKLSVPLVAEGKILHSLDESDTVNFEANKPLITGEKDVKRTATR